MPPVDLPDGTQGSTAAALDGQTGRLEQSNDEKRTVVWIYDQCEAEKTAAVQKATKRSLWGRLWPF